MVRVPQSLLAALLAPWSTLATQSAPAAWPRAVPVDSAASGIEERRDGTQVVAVRFTRPRLCDVPLGRPVQDLAVGRFENGVFVILAGGVRESLDLYRVDPASGNIDRYETHGGRRLPDATFGRGLGSLPVSTGRDLVLFAFEREREVVFSALGFPGTVHGVRRLPLSVDDYTVFHDPVTEEIRISFSADAPDLTFLHPRAPRLWLSAAEIVFDPMQIGRRQATALQLENQSDQPLQLELRVVGAAFVLGDGAETRRLELPPRQRRNVQVEFRPFEVGAATARLHIESAYATARAVVPLRGEAIEPVATGVAVVPPAPVSSGSSTHGSSAPAPGRTMATPPPLPPLERSAIAEFAIEPLATGRVLVTGRLAAADAVRADPWAELEIELAVRNPRLRRDATGPLGPDGRFVVTVDAAAGDRLELALVDRWTLEPRYCAGGRVPATLRRNGDVLVAGCRPRAEFLWLVVLAEGEDGSAASRVVRAWRGRGDASGRAELPVEFFGRLRPPFYAMILARDADGDRLASGLLAIDE
jgi:hypothetical protein